MPPRSHGLLASHTELASGCPGLGSSSLRACSSPRSTKRLRILPTGIAVPTSSTAAMAASVYPSSALNRTRALVVPCERKRKPCRAGVGVPQPYPLRVLSQIHHILRPCHVWMSSFSDLCHPEGDKFLNWAAKVNQNQLRLTTSKGVQVVSPLTLAHKVELIKTGVHARKLSEEAQRVHNDILKLSRQFEDVDQAWKVLYQTHLRNAGNQADKLDLAYKKVREEFDRISQLSEDQNFKKHAA